MSLNELPLNIAPIVEEVPGADTLDGYIEKILMKMNEDAQGFLLQLVPICLRMNVFIVNIDSSAQARKGQKPKINITESKSHYPDINFWVNDNLNFHNETIYVLRKDGHYDIILKSDDP